MIVSAQKESRPGQESRAATSGQDHHSQHTVPAPVDGGIAMLHGPLMHPDSDPAIWREYGRPPAPPWGSYLDTTPLPRHPDGRGPLEIAMATAQQQRGANA